MGLVRLRGTVPKVQGLTSSTALAWTVFPPLEMTSDLPHEPAYCAQRSLVVSESVIRAWVDGGAHLGRVDGDDVVRVGVGVTASAETGVVPAPH